MTGVVVGVSPGLGRSAGRYIPQAFGADSLLEGTGFELPVPRAMQGRPKAIIDGFGCMPPSLDSAAAVGGDQRRRAKAKSRNRSLIARGTGSLNPPPSSGESVANLTSCANNARNPSLIEDFARASNRDCCDHRCLPTSFGLLNECPRTTAG